MPMPMLVNCGRCGTPLAAARACPWCGAPAGASPGWAGWRLAGGVSATVAATIAGGLLVAGSIHVGVAVGPVPAAAGPAAQPYAPALQADGDPAWVRVGVNLPPPSGDPLPAALTDPPGPGPLVTPAAAGDILDAAWALRGRALAAGDASLLATFESGPALEEDAGRCPCSANPFGPVGSRRLFVPYQTAWPAQFLAEVITTASGGPWVQRLVFRRAGPGEPWTVVLANGYEPLGPPVLDVPASDPRGFNVAPLPASAEGEAVLPAALAAYWQAYKDGHPSQAPTSLAAGTWTSEFARQRLAPNPQGAVNSSNGLVGRYVYAAFPAADGLFTFASPGYDVVCGTVRDEKTWTPPRRGGAVVQDTARTNWGPDLAPGAYRAVIETDIYEPCFSVQAGTPAVVSGGAEYNATDVGIP